MSNTITLPLVHVIVVRSNDMKLNAHVPKHEIPVLKAVHGAANIIVPEQDEYPPEAEFNASADFEFGRLQRVYFRKNDADRVLQAYPMGAEMLVPYGFELNRGSYEQAPASSQVDFGREQRKAKAEAKKGEAAKGAKVDKKD